MSNSAYSKRLVSLGLQSLELRRLLQDLVYTLGLVLIKKILIN